MKKNTLFSKQNLHLRFAILLGMFIFLSSCTEKVLDYNHPDVEVFVKLLKSGDYSMQSPYEKNSMPRFSKQDIGKLLDYADDMSVIPSFPLAPVSYSAGGKLRLGECLLWIVETIRLGHNASMGCKMVHVGAENYEGIYFLSDQEVLDAVNRYRHWWENRKYPRTMWTVDPCYDEPLCGSGYMWW